MLSTKAVRAGSVIGAILCCIRVTGVVVLAVGWQPLS